MTPTDSRPVRLAARQLAAVLEQCHDDPATAIGDVALALQPLMGPHTTLFERAMERPTRMSRSRVLYFDPNLLLMLSAVNTDFCEAPHNHGMWNALYIVEGAMQFRWYRRLDDLSVPGHSELELVDERLLRPGDVGIVAPPPHDIHAFEVLENDTWLVTAAPAPGLFTRQIYDLESDTYVERALDTAVPVNA